MIGAMLLTMTPSPIGNFLWEQPRPPNCQVN
jgi:hypothetical protein